jgi:hypothetical protein
MATWKLWIRNSLIGGIILGILVIGIFVLRGTFLPPHPAQLQVLTTNTRLSVVAFSNDGTFVAAGDDEGRIWLWETHNGDLQAESS